MSGSLLCRTLGLEFPLLLAGMGGIAGPELAAAVSNAGCGGTLGLYKTPPGVIPPVLAEIRQLTSRSFGVNFVPEVVSPEQLCAQIDAVLEASPAQVYFTFFGIPPESAAARVRDAGRAVVIQVGTADQAREAADRGACALIAQGLESGGHHLGNHPLEALLGALKAVNPGLPVVAAGGICHGADLARLERLGAEGCLCGTLFAATLESRAHPHFRQRILEAIPEDTVITDAFHIGWPGRPHRVLRNRVTDRPGALPAAFIAQTRVGDHLYPVPRFSAAVPTTDTSGAVEEMALYCGTSCGEIHQLRSAIDVVRTFRAEYLDARDALSQKVGKSWISSSVV